MKRSPFPIVALLALIPSASPAAKVYYVNQPEGTPGTGVPGIIQAVNPDGTSHTAHYTAATNTDLRGIAVDPENNRLFFVYRALAAGGAAFDVSLRTLPLLPIGGGGAPVTILPIPEAPVGSPSTSPADVEYDRTLQHVYFSQPSLKLLRRCNPDGTGLTTVLTHPGTGTQPRDLGPYFFGLDLVRRDAYWAVLTVSGDTNTGYTKGSLNGVIDTSFSLTTPSRTRDIAVDPDSPGGPRLYWNDRQNGATYTRLAAGGSIQTVASGMNAPHGLAIDTLARKGYVSDTGKRGSGTQASSHRVVRFRLDGTGPLEFLSPVSTTAEPWDLALDLSSTTFTDWSRRFFAQGATGNQPADDPDGDGLANIAEYAFFCSPIHADATRAAQVFDLTPGALRVALHRTSDITVRVEVSSNLTDWHWNGDSSGLTWLNFSAPQPRDEDSHWVTITPAIPGQNRLMFRLRAILP